MIDNPLTKNEYVTKIKKLATLYVDLKEENLSPINIKSMICQVQRNFNMVIEFAVEALDNRVLAMRLLRSAKTNHDLNYSNALMSDDVKKLGSAELRKAGAIKGSIESARDVDAAACNKDQADSYYDSVRLMYDDLRMAYETLKEQTKLFQSTLYLEATKGA